MNIFKIENNKSSIELSGEELGAVIGALNEVCEEIELWEFSTRMGVEVEEARDLLDKLISADKKLTQML